MRRLVASYILPFSRPRRAHLTRRGGAQTDLAHDSVHAAQRAAEKEAARAAEAKKATVSGRLLDAGAAKAGAKADKADEPLRPTLNTRVHHHNPDGALMRRAALQQSSSRARSVCASTGGLCGV